MKKSLLAVAAIGAFASAAQAQSSVTVYGILDVGYIGTNLRVPQTAAPLTAGPAYKLTSNTFGQSAESTSRLGFKGTEDLGNGTSAFFTAEFQLFPQDWSLSGSSASALQTGTSTNSAGGLQNRQSFVGLSKKGIGQAAIGTQYTPIHVAVGKTDPGQQNNMIGSIIYPANGSGFTTGAYTVRSNNALTAETAVFSGFKLSAMYAMNNQDRTQLANGGATASATDGGNTNTNGWGIGADYTWNKLFVTANYQSFKNESNTTNVAPAAAGTSNVNGINNTDNQTYAGATYDFGILKAYAGWTQRKATSALNSSNYINRTGQQIGVRSFITPTIEAWANVGNGNFKAYGTGSPTANFTAYQLGANYWLSKRTNLYTIFGSTQTSASGATTSLPQGTAAGGNQYALGVRHTF